MGRDPDVILRSLRSLWMTPVRATTASRFPDYRAGCQSPSTFSGV
jgi:hypothetical protein